MDLDESLQSLGDKILKRGKRRDEARRGRYFLSQIGVGPVSRTLGLHSMNLSLARWARLFYRKCFTNSDDEGLHNLLEIEKRKEKPIVIFGYSSEPEGALVYTFKRYFESDFTLRRSFHRLLEADQKYRMERYHDEFLPANSLPDNEDSFTRYLREFCRNEGLFAFFPHFISESDLNSGLIKLFIDQIHAKNEFSCTER